MEGEGEREAGEERGRGEEGAGEVVKVEAVKGEEVKGEAVKGEEVEEETAKQGVAREVGVSGAGARAARERGVGVSGEGVSGVGVMREAGIWEAEGKEREQGTDGAAKAARAAGVWVLAEERAVGFWVLAAGEGVGSAEAACLGEVPLTWVGSWWQVPEADSWEEEREVPSVEALEAGAGASEATWHR